MREIWVGNVGDWEFYQTIWNWGGEAPRKVFTFGPRNEENKSNEWYNSIEHAMAAAIAEKYTGPRGAGGSGVGTAADWFMKMLGVVDG